MLSDDARSRSPTRSGGEAGRARSRRCARPFPASTSSTPTRSSCSTSAAGSGGRVVGHKVGLSSKAMQEMMGVDEPDYGHLLYDMVLARDAARADRPATATRGSRSRSRSSSARPARRGLHRGGRAGGHRVRRARDRADRQPHRSTGRSGSPTRSPTTPPPPGSSSARSGSARRLDLTAIDAVLPRNGEQVAEGRSDAVLGNPVTAVAWLAHKVARFGVTLEAGHVILPGLGAPRDRRRPGRRVRRRRLRRARLTFPDVVELSKRGGAR